MINVHLEASDKETRARHSEQVYALYQQYASAYPTVLLGDFNSSPEQQDESIHLFLEKPNLSVVALDDAGYEYSFDSVNPTERLDYIFYNDQLVLLEGRVAKEAGSVSDHLPVVASFRLAE